MRKFWHDNALSIVMAALFLVFLGGQTLTGFSTYNEDQARHGERAIGFGEYLSTGHFSEAVFENWESEFLQMSMYVLLTAWLIQKGSAESRQPDSERSKLSWLRSPLKRRVPWPVKRGGVTLKLYENSLFLALFALFLFSIAMHAQGGARAACQEQLAHGGECVSWLSYMTTSRFWFESFQNWQSEFLAVLAIVVLSIWLRQKDSPESKAVTDPDEKTGAQDS